MSDIFPKPRKHAHGKDMFFFSLMLTVCKYPIALHRSSYDVSNVLANIANILTDTLCV